MNKIKKKLLVECFHFLEEKTRILDEIIASNKLALLSETKSSAGDKHETGRAMLQLEMEKVSTQFNDAHLMRVTLNRIDIRKKSDVVILGSLVKTSKGNYFLSVSIGKIIVDGIDFYCISVFSPIGKLLLGSKKDHEIYYNDMKIVVNDIY